MLKLGLLFFTTIYIVVVWWLRKGWSQNPQVPPLVTDLPKVSVIIAARNEAHQIRRTLEALCRQTYPAHLMEIIVIDDHSTDATSEVVLGVEDPRIQLIQWNTSEVLNSYKKKAIAEAIAQCNGEWIVTTDADCRMHEHWLRRLLAQSMEHDVHMISGPVVFHEEKSWFERLQSLEFLYLIGLGAAAIGLGKASTCNGANLAYRKSSFHAVGGFQGIDHLASGDDELLLHKMEAAFKGGIRFCKDFDAVVYTEAKPNLKAFIQQRKRWASKSTQYRNKALVILGISIWLFNLFLLIATFYIFWESSMRYWVLGVWIAKICMEYIYLSPMMTFARRNDLRRLLIPLSILHVIYMVYIGLAGQSGKYEWKGRSVR
jgi:cellulose synthase/poly-beta-1,6-N-acetylglucosamine synthase-like glycosyltransferase